MFAARRKTIRRLKETVRVEVRERTRFIHVPTDDLGRVRDPDKPDRPRQAMKPHSPLMVEYLRECFSYDPETGVLIWRRRPPEHFATKRACTTWNVCCSNKQAGHINGLGYREIRLNGAIYRAHRLIWKLVTGEEPPAIIDHRDGDGENNKWNNLRVATSTQSLFNRRILSNIVSCIRGVSRDGKRWRASIQVDGITRYRGTFATPEEASAAYEHAAREFHGEFYRPPTKTSRDD